MATTSRTARSEEWQVIRSLLPDGWEHAAKLTGALVRRREIKSPDVLVRMLLFHASSDCGLRASTAQMAAAGLPAISQVALLKRLISAGDWLEWMSSALCRELQQECRWPEEIRPRVVDSTIVNAPASKGVDWRLHYCLDLRTSGCDWSALTGSEVGEKLAYVPMLPGDVMIADRNYLSHGAVAAATAAGAYVLIRMRWRHLRLNNPDGSEFQALSVATKVRANAPRSWPVTIAATRSQPELAGRVLIVKLPAAVADRNVRKAMRAARKEHHALDARSIKAAGYVMLFSSVPIEVLSDDQLLYLYQCRWQVELAFKRHKQLLQLGRVPHQDVVAARSWILAKLVVALLLEKLYRQARGFSPWGYNIARLRNL